MFRIPNEVTPTRKIGMLNHAATNAANSDVIRYLAGALRGFPDPVEAALRFAQNLGYRNTIADGSYYQTIEDTLREGGDCKALSVVLTALLQSLGYPARAVWVSEDAPVDHVSVLVQRSPNGPFLWAEPTVRGARVGESPGQAIRRIGTSQARPS